MKPCVKNLPASLPHIFIIDGDTSLLARLSRMFSQLEVKVCCYNNAESFLNLASIPCNSCLLLEVNLPDRNGLDLMEYLLSKGYKVPVIVWSASSDIPTVVRAMKSNAIDFIEKPIIDSLLLRQVEKAMESLLH